MELIAYIMKDKVRYSGPSYLSIGFFSTLPLFYPFSLPFAFPPFSVTMRNE